ncbi:MAG: tetratricopeptide repeat protein [Polyangiaceae bacterium]
MHRRSLNKGKPADALLVREAIELGQGRGYSYFGASMASASGDFTTARGWIEPVVKDDPRDVDAQFSFATVLERAGDRAAARDVYRIVVRLEPTHASARYSLIMIAKELGDLTEAKQLAQQFVKDFPSDARKARFVGLIEPAP